MQKCLKLRHNTTDKNVSVLSMRIAGVIITALGVLAFVVSVLQMKDNWRAVVQREEYLAYKKKGCRYIARRCVFILFTVLITPVAHLVQNRNK